MRRLLPVLAGVLAVAGLAAPVAHGDDAPTVTHGTVISFDGTPIVVTAYRPAGAGARNRVPVILDSHGWAGSRRTEIDATAQAFLDAGYGLISIDQRGHGESGGQANVQDPDIEARDIQAVIDGVARLDWVQLERPGDPVLGAIGGSYGGGYQTMTALTEQASRRGGTRFDALAPEITWFDLPDSLAPADVPRTVWLAALFAAGAPMLPPYVHQAFVEGMATGTLPASLKAEFASHGPRHFTDRGVRLDIPVLFRQGASDNLFNLNQGFQNFDAMLTPRARAASRFVSFNGGHALPNVLPVGAIDPNGLEGTDACSGPTGFLGTTIAFFDKALRGTGSGAALPASYNLTTADGSRCLHLSALPAPTDAPVGTAVTTAGAGGPQFLPLMTGKATVAGIPKLRGALTTLGVDTRFFVGLAIGTSPADARVIQNNLLPVRRAMPVTAEAMTAALPGVVADVAEGQTLYLVVTPVSDMFVAHGSRTPGVALLQNAVVELPLLR